MSSLTEQRQNRMARASGVNHVERPLPDGGTFALAYVRTKPRADLVPDARADGAWPVFVLPGGPGLASVLPYQRLRARAAKAGLDLLMMEHRGIGFSRRDADGIDLPREALTIRNVVDDIAAVLDAEGIDKVVVYGCSYGSCLAQGFGVLHPQRVAGMILDSAMLGSSTNAASARSLHSLFWEGTDETRPYAERVRGLVHSGRFDADAADSLGPGRPAGPSARKPSGSLGPGRPAGPSARKAAGSLGLGRPAGPSASKAAGSLGPGRPAGPSARKPSGSLGPGRPAGPSASKAAGFVLQVLYEFGGLELVDRVLSLLEAGKGRRVVREISKLGDREVMKTLPLRAEFDLVGEIAFRELDFGHTLIEDLPLNTVGPFATLAERYSPYEGDPFDLPQELPRFTWPTVVLSGERDLRTPRATAEEIVDLIPDATLIPIREHGHSALDTAPAIALGCMGTVARGIDSTGRLDRSALPASVTAHPSLLSRLASARIRLAEILPARLS